MSRRKLLAFALSLLVSVGVLAPTYAYPPAELIAAPRIQAPATKFVRTTRKNDRPVSMDTAIVSYVGRNAAGKEVRVDLVGAIHVGDKAYYQQLNKEFEKYEIVLYELVAPAGARPARGTEGMWSPLGKMLKLADQIAEVDYTKKNFVHADMSWDEMQESMRKRDESWLKMIGQAIGQGLVEATDPKSGASDADVLASMIFANDPALGFKRVMAKRFEDPGAMDFMAGPDGSTIIHERNKVALQGLRKQLDAGKRQIAIFYGAGHLPDMEQRLVNDFALKRGELRWVVAWKLGDEGAKKKAKAKK